MLIILLVAFLVGHLLGKLVRNEWHAFLFSVPLGAAIHVGLLVMLPVWVVAPAGVESAWACAAGLLCVPIVMYGVFLARDGNRRVMP